MIVIRKLLLSIGVTATFLVYSYGLRHQHGEGIIAPPTLSKGGSTNSTSSGNAGSTGSSPTNGQTYKDGNYTGSVANAYYGNVQVAATIQRGRLQTVTFLQYPNDNPNSQYINGQAIPYLRQEAIQAQSANVNIITGATFTSQAFMQSLGSALAQAQ
ncbi:MAG TPA: FMN-binding protein [Candidatus Saccharimonadales bacterium]|nr:FMN-binding protein [Candidatus Saccharimonadales bacterium]